MTLKVNLKPASTAVPAAAAKQKNDKYNDEKRGGIHVRLPPLRVFGMLRIAQPGNSGSLTATGTATLRRRWRKAG